MQRPPIHPDANINRGGVPRILDTLRDAFDSLPLRHPEVAALATLNRHSWRSNFATVQTGMQSAASFYEPLGVSGGYHATAATAGPWDPGSQHGGPPAALLATVMEACEPVAGFRLARITVELLGPVPVGEVVVRARVVRPGRRVRLVEATMEVDGRPVALGRAWQIASQQDLLPALPLSPPPERPPRAVRFFTGSTAIQGYGAAVEWRFITGGFDVLGSAQVWARVRIPLVADQPLTGLQRLLIVADSANGISGVLPFDEWLFVPTALTVTVHRHPRGEWIFHGG